MYRAVSSGGLLLCRSLTAYTIILADMGQKDYEAAHIFGVTFLAQFL
jgi:hypothetical protein